MSLDHSPRTASCPPDELVPSRYALRVGEIEVLVLSDGVLTMPASALATNAAPAELAQWLHDGFLPREVFEWPVNVLVVRSGGRTVLVDSGIGTEYPDATRAGRLAHRLDAAGIDPASVTDVVLTHMHMDHIGGLLSRGLKDRLRRDVPIHVAAAEIGFWAAPDFAHTAMPPQVPPVLRSAAKRFVETYRDQLRPFETEHEVAPGVIAQRTGGHTPGHSVVRLASQGERLTFVGDAIFPVGFDHPEWFNGFEHDPVEAARVRYRLLREFASTGDLMMGTHLSFPSVGRVAVAGNAFRLIPAYWEY